MKNRRFPLLKVLTTAAIALGGAVLLPMSKASANPALQLFPLGWNVIGLDSNKVSVGPDYSLIGARVCNTGTTAATNVTATINLGTSTTSGSNISVLSFPTGTSGSTSTLSIPSLPSGTTAVAPGGTGVLPNNCFDFYFPTKITRTTAAYSTLNSPNISGRQFSVNVTADGIGSLSTPTNRELYVEQLISQGRNSVVSITGPSMVYVGETVEYTVKADTSTQGYEQLVVVPELPVFFQLLSASTTYSASSVASAANNNSVYADACGWQNDYTQTNSYHNNRTCSNNNKVGGTIQTTYKLKVLGTGSGNLSNVIYDYSGSSYHYNSDYGTGVNLKLITAVLPPDLTITKTHSGNFIQGQTGATYTLTATNSGSAATSGTVSVTDSLPTGLTPKTASGTGWTCTISGQTVTCTRSDALAAGSSYPAITLTADVAINAASSLTNTASVSGGGEIKTDNNSASDTTTITLPSDLTITKTHTGTFTQGQTGSYTLTATNSGINPTIGTVTVTDTLPTGLTYKNASGTGWTCSASGQTVTCTRSDILAIASSYPAITLTVDVASNAASPITNTATVSGGGEIKTDNNSASDSTTINAVARPPSICSVAGGNLGTNLFTDNGTFGRLSGSPAQSTFGSPLPSGRTTYSYDINSSSNYARGIDDGEYTIINKPTQTTFRTDGAWHLPYDHTEGSPSTNGLMMLINASYDPGVFYQETLNVTSNTNYEFSAWIINILKPQNAGIDPNIAFEVDRIGVDDDNNPNTADGSEGQIIISSGDITESASPTWLNYGTIINSGAATQMVVRFRNNAPGGGGNDLAIDDLLFAPCTPLPSGNISGTLYGDSNTNGNFDSGEPRVKAGVQVQLVNSSNAIIATTQTDNSGNYLFQNIPLSNYTIKVITTDPDLQGATASSPSNAQLSASLTTAGQNLNNKNFGFTGVPPQPNLLLVKRITAINGDRTKNPNDGTALDTFVNDPSTADDNSKWSTPSTYLKGSYNGGKVKPGDEVEYTIYFLNTEAAAKNVTLCDRIPDNMTLVPTGYNAASPHPTESGAIPTDTGIGFALNASTLPTNPTAYLTNVGDSDRGRYYPPYDPNTPSTCKVLDALGNATASGSAANTNGAVVVDVVKGTGTANQLPPATAPGTPPNSYGFIRFKAKVN